MDRDEQGKAAPSVPPIVYRGTAWTLDGVSSGSFHIHSEWFKSMADALRLSPGAEREKSERALQVLFAVIHWPEQIDMLVEALQSWHAVSQPACTWQQWCDAWQGKGGVEP